MSLKKIGQLFKNKAIDQADYALVCDDVDTFVQLIHVLVKEFKNFSKHWTNISEFILRIDEMVQARSRISDFSNNDEDGYRHHLDSLDAEKKLQACLDRFKYLQNLATSLVDKNEVEARICCICYCDMSKGAVMKCGHFYCADCLDKLQSSNCFAQFISCAICRQRCATENIYRIETDLNKFLDRKSK